MASLRWKNVDLNDTTTPFNPNYIYRIFNEGWMMAVNVTSTVLYFLPSCGGNFYGSVEYSQKRQWDYKIKGDCAKRPPEHPGYAGPVEKLQYLEIESD